MKTQNETTAPINPIVHAIPEGQKVTVFTARGMRFTGTDDTSGEEAEKGIFVLYSDIGGTRGAPNKKTYLLASEVVGFEMFYE